MSKNPAFMNWHEKNALNLEGFYLMTRTYMEYDILENYLPVFTKSLPDFKIFRLQLAESSAYIRDIKNSDPNGNNEIYDEALEKIDILRGLIDWGEFKERFPEGLEIDISGSEFDFDVSVLIIINWKEEKIFLTNRWTDYAPLIIFELSIMKITENMIKE